MISNRDEFIAFAKANSLDKIKKEFEENLENTLLAFNNSDDFITAYKEAPALALALIDKQPGKFIPILENIVLANLKEFFSFSDLCHQYSYNLIYDFIRNYSDQIAKLFKTEDEFIAFARRHRTEETSSLLSKQPRYFVNLFHTNIKTDAMARFTACDCSAGAHLISLIKIVQQEKQNSTQFYTRGAMFGLFKDSLPSEMTANVSEYLTLEDGVQVARASQSAHSSAEIERFSHEKKIGRF